MDYKGTIIEESLENKDILKDLTILKTRVEKVTENHKMPWFKQWTLHTFQIPENQAESIARKLGKAIDSKHSSWYVDFKNKNFHYIIFKQKIFKVRRDSEEDYAKARRYGISLGIPEYQVDFSPDIE